MAAFPCALTHELLSSSHAELMQTEMHHVRTLKIMNDVYSAAMLKELQFDQQAIDKLFPCLENLLHIHSQFFQRILERKKESLADKSEKNFVIRRIGDILVNQVSAGKCLQFREHSWKPDAFPSLLFVAVR